jgi:hypothetical protein
MLNKPLYDTLVRVFKSVQVANEGVPFEGMLRKPATASGYRGYKAYTVTKGETYRVCCPFCKDTRHRLWIGHRWGTKFRGERITHAECCYNENCHETKDFYVKLCDYMAGYTPPPMRSDIVSHADAAEVKTMELPGVCVPINTLRQDHAAATYLKERKYDIDELATQWGVVWRTRGSALHTTYRLVIPVYDVDPATPRLVGWQVRYFDTRTGCAAPTDKHIPKYMTAPGFRKARALFNGQRAFQQPYVVICEGPFDAMRVGANAVALLGAVASNTQVDMLVAACASSQKPIAVMLDNDMDETADELVDKLKTRGCLAFRAKAPHDKDPGDCTRAELHAAILRALSTCIVNYK